MKTCACESLHLHPAHTAADVELCLLLYCLLLQLYGMYMGEGEAVLRDTFRRARLASPSIIFLDEADALAPRRQEGSGGDQGTSGGPDAGLRLLSTLLTEIDGLEETQGGWSRGGSLGCCCCCGLRLCISEMCVLEVSCHCTLMGLCAQCFSAILPFVCMYLSDFYVLRWGCGQLLKDCHQMHTP
jgi:SpoVK/Ycf46/Vps4 family AAA+-type ATPase